MTKANRSTLYTKAQAARIVGVVPAAVSMRISRGKMRVERIHGGSLVSKTEILKWQAERKAQADKLTNGGTK